MPLYGAVDGLGAALKLGWRLAALGAASVAAVQLVVLSPPVACALSAILARSFQWMAARFEWLSAQLASLSRTADTWNQRAQAARASPATRAPPPTEQATAAPPPRAAPAPPAPAARPSKRKGAVTGDPAAYAMEVRKSVSGMRVKQLKSELTALGVAHADAVEKIDLVERCVLCPPFDALAPS